MAQFFFKLCFLLFTIKSVLASPLSTSSSTSDLSTLSELADILLEDLPSESTLLISRDEAHPAEHTHLITVPESQDIADPRGKRAAGVKGMCSLHLWEADTCGTGGKTPRYAAVELKNSAGKVIVRPNRGANGGLGTSIDRTWEVTSQLPWVLLIDGNGKKNNVQFKYGRYSWMSNTKKRGPKDPYCIQGGWDPRIKRCGVFGHTTRRKQMDCFFPCP
ncbi:hypothetical protein AJ78_05576 [Emergomyces pasteurianus Ep9510]|uniref:Uncharacterized protein n=1 Tax=Emergomyces pasteurianus Ep9510 TaxID=1447872 RepID=A0A1J9QFR7_9EURO|nr:hypothetical protein AJ78_05576 [Emergomyces pasteurianus Ep9510]